MALTMSHVAGPTTPAVREMTFGDLLRNAAESAPNRLALIAGVPDPAQRRQPSPAIPEEAVRNLERAVDRLTPRERDRADRGPIEGGPHRDLPQSSRTAHSTAASWRSFNSSTRTRTFSE